jgi:predicted DCC family thiol-disulfide oxidoreductase YuxK
MNPILLFDGVCNLCNSSVQFIIRHDRQCLFRFASLQSDLSREWLQIYGLSPEQRETVVLIYNNRAYTQSDAVLEIAKLLGGYWQYAYYLRIIPTTWRNVLYRFVARNRYKWFGQQAQCMIPTPEQKARFL